MTDVDRNDAAPSRTAAWPGLATAAGPDEPAAGAGSDAARHDPSPDAREAEAVAETYARGLAEALEEHVFAQPLRAVATAAALGFLAGWLAAR